MAAPLLQLTLPSDNATGVSVTANLGLGFDQAVKAGSGFIRIYKSDGTLFHTIAITDTSQVTFSTTQPARVVINPNVDLVAGTGYYILVDAGAIENAGGEDYAGLSSSTTLNFTTSGSAPGDTVAPLLNATTPADNATGVTVASNLVLTFNEAVKAGSGNVEIRKVSDGSVALSIPITDGSQVSFSGNQLTINPSSDLAPSVSYYVSFGSGVVRDLANNPFAGISAPTQLNFSTAAPDPNQNLVGTLGPDTLNGEDGNDTLNGLTGLDTLIGGTGDDTFVINNYEGGGTSILLYSEPGEYVGDGQTLSFSPAPDEVDWNLFDLTGDGLIDFLRFYYYGDQHLWMLAFSTSQLGTNLAPGTYLDAERAGFASPGHPGLDVAGDGRGSNEVFGRFTVTDIVIDYSGPTPVVVSLSISFEQHSESPAAPALYGTLNYEYAPAGPLALDQIVENPGEGTDTVLASVNYALTANVENLTLTGLGDLSGTGNGLANLITGNAGDNLLDGGGGADTMVGLGGDDTYVVDNGGDSVVENWFSGNDTVQSSVTHTLAADVENLTLTGSANINATGNALANTLTANSGINVLAGGAGDDTYVVDSAADSIVENPNEGNDRVLTPSTYTLGNNVENLTLTGNANVNGTGNGLDNTLTGNHQQVPGMGQNILTGGGGNDTLNGGTGLDTLIGGSGDDTYVISNYEGGEYSILLQSEPGDWIGGGQTLSFIPDNDDVFSVTAYDGTSDGIVDWVSIWYHDEDYGHWWTLSFSTTQLGTNLVPGTYLDAERASFASAGHPGLDISGDGRGSNDVFGSFIVTEAVFDYSGSQPVVESLSISFEQHSEVPNAPALYGTVNYNYAAAGAAALDGIVEDANKGTDTVLASISYALAANLENLTLTGFDDINGTGNTLNNLITGNSGDNTLDGGAGADTMTGSEGGDTYVVDDAGDTVVEDSPYYSGTDTVQSSVTYSLSANIENLTLTGSANVGGTGNDHANVLIGNAGSNVLSGGMGDDTYVAGSGDSIVENPDAGNDTVESATTHVLADNVENLMLTGTGNINGTGNSLANILTGSQQLPGGGGQNVLTGGAGNDTLNGRTGIDTLIGGLGDDTYIIDNYEGGETSILLQSQPGDYIGGGQTLSLIPLGPEDLTVSAYDGTGDGIVDSISFWYHDADYDHWFGLNFSTTQLGTNLVPGTYLNAERAAFATPGHPGLDVYGDGRGSNQVFGSFTVTQAVFDYSGPSPVLVSLSITFEQYSEWPNAAPLFGTVNYNYLPAGAAMVDSVVEDGGQGTDTVQAAVSYVLGANLENLTLTGTSDINGTGNALNNTIIGNGDDNVLDGLGGADTMVGGYGGDIYFVDDIGDVVIEDWTYYDESDTVQSLVTFVLGANIETLILNGNLDIDGSGNGTDNSLTGNTGHNVLNGGGGNDTLLGGGGNDLFKILAGDGNDEIGDFSAGVGAGDVLELDGFKLADFEDVQAAMTQSGGNTVLNLGNGQTLTFLNFLPNAFAADDFTFVNVQPSGPEPFTLPVSGAYTNTITGSRRADNLTGTSANNRLDGKQGADTMTGLAGDDTYVVDTSGDNVVETTNNGIDTVISSASSYTLANNVENLTLTGTTNHTATGNGLNNLIIASSRPDTINGGAGNDILRAGTGACVLTGGAGNDIFAFPVAGSQKQVTDFHAGEDLVDLRPLLGWYGGSDPVADNVIALSTVTGGVLLSVKATAIGSLQGLVKLTGVSLGDLDIGSDILWE